MALSKPWCIFPFGNITMPRVYSLWKGLASGSRDCSPSLCSVPDKGAVIIKWQQTVTLRFFPSACDRNWRFGLGWPSGNWRAINSGDRHFLSNRQCPFRFGTKWVRCGMGNGEGSVCCVCVRLGGGCNWYYYDFQNGCRTVCRKQLQKKLTHKREDAIQG